MRRRHPAGPDPLDVIWPSHIKFYPDYAEVGDRVVRSYAVTGYPREVHGGWFEPLLGFPNPIALVIRSAPVDSGDAVKSMSRRMIWHRGAAEADRVQGRIGRAEQLVALDDADKVRLDLAKGETRMIEVGLTVLLWAPTLDALDQSTRMFESLAQGMMLVVRPLRYQQQAGLRQMLPLGEPVDKVREMDSRAWATLFPFSARDVIHPHGQVMGVNPYSQSLIIADRFQLASPHSITIGWSGAGKSFAAKLEALHSRYRGWAISIIDPEGEYRWLENSGARVHRLGAKGPNSGLPYDPFTVGHVDDPEESTREIDFLLRFLRRLSPELTNEFGSLVHDAVWRIVKRHRERFSLDSVDGLLTMNLLVEELGHDNRRASERLDMVWQRWQMAVGVPSLLAPSQRFEVFDFSRVAEGMKGAVYLALTEWLLRCMGRETIPHLIIFDEAWHLLNDDESAAYLEQLFRRARKWGTALSLLSQDIGDFTRNRAAEVCLRNAPMVLLLRQHPESVAEVAELLRLHDGEIDIVSQAGPGEGLLLLGDDHLPIRIIASHHEQAMMAKNWGGEAS